MRRMRPVGLALAFFAVAVAAAEPAPEGREELVVTASRTPGATGRPGASVTVISREDIERRNPAFLTDLLRDVPGFSIARAGGAGKLTQLRVRGAEANQLLVLIDGIEANDVARDDAFDFANLATDDIERVEIVRGPQSALWGSDALAGVVNVITRRGAGAPRATASVEHGSFGSERVHATLGAGDERRDASVAVSYVETGGINIAERGDEEDGYRNATVNTRLGWQAMPDLRLDFSGRLADIHTATDGDLGLGVPSDTPGETDSLQAYAQGKARLSTFDGRWLHQLAGSWSKTDNQDVDPAVFVEGRTVGHKHGIDYQTSFIGETARVVHARHSLTFALDYEQQRFRQRGPVTVFGDPNQDRDYRNLGYVGEYRVVLDDATTLGASGRWDDYTAFADIGTYRAFVAHDLLATGTTLTAAYATGQKAPTFFERFGFSSGGVFSPPFIGNAALKPETSRGWEIGVVQKLRAGRVVLGATWFDERLEDEINGFVVDPVAFTATALNMAGRSERQGLELTGSVAATERIALRANYTYLDATQPDRANRRHVDEVRRPRHQFAASADWTSPDRRAMVDLHLSHTGERQDDSFLPPLFAPARVSLDAYTLLGIAARYRVAAQCTLLGRIENALDDDYQEVYGYRTEGVSAYVGLRIESAR